jgi:hypothetical protein
MLWFGTLQLQKAYSVAVEVLAYGDCRPSPALSSVSQQFMDQLDAFAWGECHGLFADAGKGAPVGVVLTTKLESRRRRGIRHG